MKVYYAFDKLGAMRRNKPALTVIYENEEHPINRFYKTLWNAYCHPFYERKQINAEAEFAKDATRIFSTYTYFFKNFSCIGKMLSECINDDLFLVDNHEDANEFEKAFYLALEVYKRKMKLKLKI